VRKVAAAALAARGRRRLTLLAQSPFFRHHDFYKLALALSAFDVAGGVERVERAGGAAMKLAVLTFGSLLALPTLAAAQHEQHGADGERLGTVNFATSCKAETRGDFNRAVALLHSFEFRPAAETFTKVLAADPGCAIAHWGLALCHWGNPFAGIKTGPPLERGRDAAQKGLATGAPTPRERAYIAAVNELYKDAATVPHRDRTIAYARAMDRVQRANPNDTEARIFYALALNQTAAANDKTYKVQLEATQILEPLWKKLPDHPGLPHYIIHAYDHPPLAEKALAAARRYAEIAPSAPHALHMPSHTFTRVGYWKDSVDTNIKSERTALQQNVIGEALHAMDYQAYAYLQMAQDQKAKAVLDRLAATAAKLDMNAMGGAAPPVAGVYARNAIAARYALERGMWAEAAALRAQASPFPHVDAITHFARALGAARSGNAAAARSDVQQLMALRDKSAAAKDAYWTEIVDIQRQIANAWIAFAEGRKDEAISLMRKAADAEDATDKAAISPGPIAPARELLGEMLLEAGNARDALAAFEATMQKEPNRFRGAFGAARAAEALGNKAAAAKYYRQVLTIAKDSDNQRPELKRARSFTN
jgi:tetratricopeptide (TPR) repeat protein